MAAVRNEDRLQQYFDGELSAEEREAVRLELEASDDLRAKLRGLEHLSKMVRDHHEAEQVDGAAMWAAIEEKIAAKIADDDPMFPQAVRPEPARPALSVIAGGKKDEAKPAEKKRPRSLVWLGVAGTITAAAAAVLLFVVPQINGPGVTDSPLRGSHIEEVDFGYSTGAVFSVEGQQGEKYAVVWISDEKPLVDGEEDEGIQ